MEVIDNRKPDTGPDGGLVIAPPDSIPDQYAFGPRFNWNQIVRSDSAYSFATTGADNSGRWLDSMRWLPSGPFVSVNGDTLATRNFARTQGSGADGNDIDSTRLTQDSILVYYFNGLETGRDTIAGSDDQTLTYNGSGSLTIESGNTVDLSDLLDNTDTQLRDSLIQDSILVYYTNGVEVGRDTISGTGGGAGTDDQTASEVNITDAGGFYTGTEVETALQEIGDSIAVHRTDIDAGGGGAAIGGSGTTNTLPLFTASTTLGDSWLSQASNTLTLAADKAFRITGGSTAARPAATAGLHYYNTDLSYPQWSDGVSWNPYGYWSPISGGITYAENTTIGGDILLENTTFSNLDGVVYKNGNRFIHDFNYGNNGTVTTDGFNTFVGGGSGNLTMGSTATATAHASYNVGIGFETLLSNTIGYSNFAIGFQSLRANTTGFANTGVGYRSLRANTTGFFNSGVGGNSLDANTTGSRNTAIGKNALSSITTTSDNTAIGYNAGISTRTSSSNQTGRNSVLIGSESRVNANGETNQIVIGYSAIGNGSNTFTLGNSSIVHHYLSGTGQVNISGGTTAQRQTGVDGDLRYNSDITGFEGYYGAQWNKVVSSEPTTGTIYLDAAKTVGIFHGTGSPEGVISASIGSTYHRTDGGAGTSYYIKESGTGNTGWVAK